MTSKGGRKFPTIWSFVIILVVFLFIADGFVIFQQTKLLRTIMAAHVEKEFNLFEKLISGSLTKGDYVSVEEAVNRWGETQKDILELSISSANGFTIAKYKRDLQTSSSRRFQVKLEYGLSSLVTIMMVRDVSAISAETTRLAYNLVAFSILLVAILGLLLQRTAVQPLQREITERLQAEEKLQFQTDELQIINKEMESFSYSLSHDLRSPLRSISGFSQILQEDAGHKLSANDVGNLKRIIAASHRMAELIDNILILTRVAKVKLVNVDVDFTAMAEHVVDNLESSNENRSVNWKIEPGLSVFGDKELLSLLLANIIGNAWKYTGNKDNARIQFGVTPADGESIYFVKDNGIGFDVQYADKIFGAFQRLHGEEVYSGTGIGLSIVQRIVHRHGGRVWAESAEGRGATFFFTVPG